MRCHRTPTLTELEERFEPVLAMHRAAVGRPLGFLLIPNQYQVVAASGWRSQKPPRRKTAIGTGPTRSSGPGSSTELFSRVVTEEAVPLG